VKNKQQPTSKTWIELLLSWPQLTMFRQEIFSPTSDQPSSARPISTEESLQGHDNHVRYGQFWSKCENFSPPTAAQPSPVPGENFPLVRRTETETELQKQKWKPSSFEQWIGEKSEGPLNYQWKNDTRSSWLVFHLFHLFWLKLIFCFF